MFTLKRMLTFLITAIMIGSLMGCGETVPDLTKEQETAISEYAVELITKHSKESDNRIQLPEEAPEDTFFEEGRFDEEREATEESTDQTSENTDTQDAPSNDSSLDESLSGGTSVIGTESSGDSGEENIETPVYSERSIDQIFGTSDVAISYNGYEVMETYVPESNSYFSLTATRGKKFVALYFNISNLTDHVVNINMNSLDVKYSFGDANAKKKKLEHTVTTKDIYSYVGDLEPGQTDTLVGLVEMVESDIEQIETPVLSVEYGGNVDVLLLR